MTPFELRNYLGNILNQQRKDMFFQEPCQSLFWASTFDLSDLPQVGLWLHKMETYYPQFLKINISLGHPSGHVGATWGLVDPVSKDALISFRDSTKGRKHFPRQDGLFKVLVNVLQLFSFTTPTFGLREIISKLGQKIYNRCNPDQFPDNDSDFSL